MSRRFVSTALAVLLTCGVAGPTLAQDWPAPGKTIQLIVPAPGGSGTGDTIARVLAEEMQTRLKTTFVIDGEGIVRKVFPRVRVDGHAEQVLAALAEL